MIICEFSVANATPTCPPLLFTSLLLGLSYVSSSAIQLIIKGTAALTYHPIESSSPGTSSSMKRPSLSLSVMVPVLQQTSSFLPMTVLILCPLLLDRRTSVYLQGLPPAPSTPPAPLPVPVRPCLGRPWSLPRMLRILGRPHSTFPLPCVCQGRPPCHARPPGVSLPRHARPWSCPMCCMHARLPRVLRCLLGTPWATTRFPTPPATPAAQRLHVRLQSSTTGAAGCPDCGPSRPGCCTGRPHCCCRCPAAQRGGSCSSGSQPALHGHTIEERLQDAFYLPRRASLTGAEDLP